ncbi:hypothetical protein LSH36_1350g00012 [Paralvinella palmiformis]|uniref:Uncharacterized protein n=1 Tax=Paralvinella palmiformis TaxID=53620 RepID=A0AAD9ITS2_9ANNE|nr:hypothetical protein LSH36_1350g00012 [Paralvinella palmiformis]
MDAELVMVSELVISSISDQKAFTTKRLGEGLGIIEYLYPAYASRSLFLIDRLDDYYLGGIDDMVSWTINLFNKTIFMFDRGTEICHLPENPLYISCDVTDDDYNVTATRPMIGRRFGKPKMDMSHFQKLLLPVRDDNLYVEEAENGFIYKVSEKYKPDKFVVKCLCQVHSLYVALKYSAISPRLTPFESEFRISSICDHISGSGLSATMLLFIVISYLLSGVPDAVDAERVLLLPIQMRPNVYRHLAIARHLESLGNDVYIVVPDRFPWQSYSQSTGVELIRYKQQDNDTFYDSRLYRMLSDEVNAAKNVHSIPQRSEEYQSVVATKMCRWMLDDKEFLHEVKFMNFHVALVDAPEISPCNIIVPWSFGIPYVLISSAYPPPAVWIQFPSFVPDPTTRYADRMTFWQRLDNLHTHRRLRITPAYSSVQDNELLSTIRKRGQSDRITWPDVIADASMYISLRDYVLEWPIPTLPNHVTVPGILQQPGKALPTELESYMLEADRGVILVTFGTMYDRPDPELVQKLFDAFRKLDFHGYRILMKMDPERMNELTARPDGVPGNIWIVTWLPQNDVLAYAKTKLFISSCGNNGQYEALYHGVPIIGLPLYGDQYHNCFRMQEKGFGICMDAWRFTPEELTRNFNLLLEGRAYKQRIHKRVGHPAAWSFAQRIGGLLD